MTVWALNGVAKIGVLTNQTSIVTLRNSRLNLQNRANQHSIRRNRAAKKSRPKTEMSLFSSKYAFVQ